MPKYRSRLHSPLDATTPKYRSNVISPADASSPKYRSTCHSPGLVAEWTPPPWGLWAWYKFNEGAGLTVYDYSGTSYGNATLYTLLGDPTTKFWSTPGFGHNSLVAPLTWCWRTSVAVPNCYYNTIAGFVKPLGYHGGIFELTTTAFWCGNSSHYFKVGWSNASPYRWGFASANSATDGLGDFAAVSPTLGTWYFVFARSAASSTGKSINMSIRTSGGALTSIISVAAAFDAHGSETLNLVTGGNNAQEVCDIGDTLYWIGSDPAIYLTTDQADNIYQNLKDRYGMT